MGGGSHAGVGRNSAPSTVTVPPAAPCPQRQEIKETCGQEGRARGCPWHSLPALELRCVHPAGHQHQAVSCSSPRQCWAGKERGREGRGQAGLCGMGVFLQFSGSQFPSCLWKTWLLCLWEALPGDWMEALTPGQQPWLGTAPGVGLPTPQVGSARSCWGATGGEDFHSPWSSQLQAEDRGTWAEAAAALRPHSIPWVPKPREPQCAAASCPQRGSEPT